MDKIFYNDIAKSFEIGMQSSKEILLNHYNFFDIKSIQNGIKARIISIGILNSILSYGKKETTSFNVKVLDLKVFGQKNVTIMYNNDIFTVARTSSKENYQMLQCI